MKFLHLADLHFGKSIYGVSLLEKGDQPVWVERFLQLVCEIQPDVIVIAGMFMTEALLLAKQWHC